jgi:uncharacterized membrane protein YhaH (DUF805 family)
MQWLELFSFPGRTSRKFYFLVGVAGILLKSNIDRMVATYVFGRDWGFLNYWFPFPDGAHPWLLSSADRKLSFTLLALSLPFIWLGIAQTVRRLRDCGQPVWLSFLFFVPFVNLIFFTVLCCLPSQGVREADPIDLQHAGRLGRTLADSNKFGAALLAALATSILGVAAVALGTQYQANYGWGLFVGLPFCLGLFSSLVYSYHTPRSQVECIGVSVVPLVLLSIGILLFAMEGVLCIAMAAPIGMGLSVLGGIVGFWVQAGRWKLKGRPVLMGMVLAIAPIWMGIDPTVQGEPCLLKVQSAIEIDAPPEVVWKKVVSFSDIPSERDWLFHTGIAYPIRATISGSGPGAIRRCEFSTGPFVEPIEVWDEPRLLRFAVTQNPAPMEELTPYHRIETPHLQGYFVSHQGQFELTRLPGNHTKLEGTTWYTDRVWPAAYWQLWSDYIIHRIHLRVLRHIREEAESASKMY